jgi:hypothetical protein
MKKSILSIVTIFSLSACGMFGGGSNEGGGGSQLGTFHPGPYTDEATGKTCNAPGGYCEDDKSCHSSASKCKKQ